MKGIDVSSYQSNIDFKAVKNSGIEIVYIKATEGVTWTDPCLTQNYQNAKNARLKVGFYHFLRANNPINEAQHFLDATKNFDADCKYAIDVEITLGQTAEQISDNVVKFAEYLKQQNKGVCLYTYSNFYNNNLTDVVKNYPLWIANYSNTEPSVPHTGWQYSENGQVPGILGNCDMDTFADNILLDFNAPVITIKPVQQPQTGDNNIRNLQHTLNVLKIPDYQGRALVEDGFTGARTVSAVKKFQQIVGISSDGIAGQNTWNAINTIFTKPYAYYSTNAIIVRYLQYRAGTVIDGIWGWRTDRLIKTWQSNHGLYPDGKVGNNTWGAMLS
ncbi:GH25 family lysozyme [Clostridium sp. JN-9]|uniref:GH25 family lysozyme n=1 Tax=Clostridium sp. JN-9 TaxID=2507159 RepID=UPI000FFE1DC9|nr:GH25 family lysozyme [Clostridium sp. JN-9]QAT39541.1 autolysin [Clostridium sp. JN-9]